MKYTVRIDIESDKNPADIVSNLHLRLYNLQDEVEDLGEVSIKVFVDDIEVERG